MWQCPAGGTFGSGAAPGGPRFGASGPRPSTASSGAVDRSYGKRRPVVSGRGNSGWPFRITGGRVGPHRGDDMMTGRAPAPPRAARRARRSSRTTIPGRSWRDSWPISHRPHRVTPQWMMGVTDLASCPHRSGDRGRVRPRPAGAKCVSPVNEGEMLVTSLTRLHRIGVALLIKRGRPGVVRHQQASPAGADGHSWPWCGRLGRAPGAG